MILKGFRSVALLSPPLSSRIRPEKGVLDPEFPVLENKPELPLGKNRPKRTHLELARETSGIGHFLEKGHQTGCIQVDLGHGQFHAGSSRCPGDAVSLGIKPLEGVGQILKGHGGASGVLESEGDRPVEALDLRVDGQFRAAHVGAPQGLPEVRVGPLEMNGPPRFHPDPDQLAVLVLRMDEKVPSGDLPREAPRGTSEKIRTSSKAMAGRCWAEVGSTCRTTTDPEGGSNSSHSPGMAARRSATSAGMDPTRLAQHTLDRRTFPFLGFRGTQRIEKLETP